MDSVSAAARPGSRDLVRLARSHEDDVDRSAGDPDGRRCGDHASDWHTDHPEARQRSVLGAVQVMALDLLITLIAGFLFVALVAGYATSAALTATSPERRRLHQLAGAGGPAE